MTGISCCLALATLITCASTSAALRFPKTSNYNFLSGSTAPTFITTVSLMSALIILSPRSPLKVAVIPTILYLFISKIDESNLVPLMTGTSEKNSESISSIKRVVPVGILPVRRSL
jgi:hypothetical protein